MKCHLLPESGYISDYNLGVYSTVVKITASDFNHLVTFENRNRSIILLEAFIGLQFERILLNSKNVIFAYIFISYTISDGSMTIYWQYVDSISK